MKGSRAIIAAAAIIAIAAIGIVCLALRQGRSTGAVSADEPAIRKKVAQERTPKKKTHSERAKSAAKYPSQLPGKQPYRRR